MHALTKVLTKKKLNAKWLTAPYDPGAHLHERTDQFLAWCGRALSAHGLAVIAFDISSDSFELSVVRTSELSALQKAAKQLGGGIDSFAPKKPLTVPLPSATREAPKKFESVQTPQLWMGRNEHFRVPGVTIEAPNDTTVCDLRTWPPTRRSLGAPKLTYASSPRGHEVAHRIVRLYRDGAWTEPPTGAVLATLRGKRTVELISAIPRGLGKSKEQLSAPRSAGEHGVLVRVGRSGNAKLALLRLVHFDGRPMTDIAASAFGVRSDDTVEAFGVTDHWLWVAHQKAIKRLPLRAFV